MCNASGHAWDCDCGFGGDTGGGAGGAWRLRYGAVISGERYSGGWYSDTDGTVASYVNHNARCPECGKPVFFYRSPYNGRVYFDHLGWPWPKHPCTDRSGEPKRHFSQGTSEGPAAAWTSEGWKPLLASKVHSAGDRLLVTGDVDGKFVELRLPRSCRVDRTSPVLVKRRDQLDGIFDVTFLRSDAMEIRPQRTTAFASKLLHFGDDALAGVVRGEAEPCSAVGNYILWELDEPEAALPYLLRAAESGHEDALLTLSVLALLKR